MLMNTRLIYVVVNFLSPVIFIFFVSTSLAYITIPQNKRKTKITWNKKLTTTYTAQLQYMHTYLVCWYCHEWTFSDESGLSQAKRYIFLLESPEVLVLKCFFPYDFYLVWYTNFKPWQLSYLLMMQIVEMSTSVEFKMWSMSPLINLQYPSLVNPN